ncbi:MAG: hypothetical protein EBR40_11800 [Proteobacteria bacterium]|nr:hypothetical protein [Pseudomonadota bacterium]
MNGPTFTVHVESVVTMTVEEVWPDKDGPKDPTAEDVAEAMEWYMRSRRVRMYRMLDDWGLMDSNDLSVTVAGPGLEGTMTSVQVKGRIRIASPGDRGDRE